MERQACGSSKRLKTYVTVSMPTRSFMNVMHASKKKPCRIRTLSRKIALSFLPNRINPSIQTLSRILHASFETNRIEDRNTRKDAIEDASPSTFLVRKWKRDGFYRILDGTFVFSFLPKIEGCVEGPKGFGSIVYHSEFIRNTYERMGIGSSTSAESDRETMEKVKEIVRSAALVVFSKSYCPYCTRGTSLFERIVRRAPWILASIVRSETGRAGTDLLSSQRKDCFKS